MGYSTELFCNLSFIRKTFNTKDEVLDKIDEYQLYLRCAKDRLKNLVIMTEPKKFCPEEDDVLGWINVEFRKEIDLIEEYSVELFKLETLLHYWDNCHDENGLAIDFPDNIDFDTAFLEGDFVKSVKYPNAHE